jgi:uncharacterized protein YkwD
MTGPSHIELRTALLAAAALLGALIVLLGPGAASGQAADCPNSSAAAYRLSGHEARRATLCLINRERAKRGLHALHAEKGPQQAAGAHNRLMLRKDCFSHQCAGERDLVGRIEASGYLPCSCSWSVGENIAWGSGSSSSPRQIVDAWMGSPPHRANILNGQFEHIGVAVDRGSPDGPGDAATYTTDFGFKD